MDAHLSCPAGQPVDSADVDIDWPVSAPELGQSSKPWRERKGQSSLLLRRLRRSQCGLAVCTPQQAPETHCSFKIWLADLFDVHETVGQGTTSLVQRAIRRSDSLEVALKMMVSSDPEMVDFVRAEYEMLRHLRHPHIIKAEGFLSFKDRAVLVLEYFNGVSLDEALELRASHTFSESTTRRLTKALLQTVSHLHQHFFIHRDIKAQNILISKDMRDIRLIDFNTACCLKTCDSLTPTGTRLHAAPEVVLGESPSAGADIWGVGLCAYLMLSGRLPQRREPCGLSQQKLQEAARHPVKFSGSCWEKVSESCKDVLKRCLSLDVHERATPKVLLEMSWFQDNPLVAAPAPCGIDSVKSPLLPGLEPTEHGVTRRTVHGPTSQCVEGHVRHLGRSRSFSTSCLEGGLVWFNSQHPSGREEPEVRRGRCRSEYQDSLSAQSLLDPGLFVEIARPESETERPFQMEPRIGEKAFILMVDVTGKIYKVRFPDGSVAFAPVEHTKACG